VLGDFVILARRREKERCGEGKRGESEETPRDEDTKDFALF